VVTGMRGSSLLWSKWRERKGWATRHALWESCPQLCAPLQVQKGNPRCWNVNLLKHL